MPSEPVYAIPCGDINQYQYWGEAFLDALSKGKLIKFLMLILEIQSNVQNVFFNHCQSVATLSHHKMIPVIHKLTKPMYLYVYECSSPRAQTSNA